MKGFLKSLVIFTVSLIILILGTFTALGEEKTLELEEHKLSLTVSENYLLLNTENANKNKDIVQAFGYTVSSFKTYLEQNSIITFGLDKESKTQLILKCWETDFSADIIELSSLNDDSLSQVVKKLVTVGGSSWRTATVNGMKMIEVRFAGTDNSGDYYSVQYITIRNGKIYSLGNIFSGQKSEEKTTLAFNTVKGLVIKDVKTASPWTASAVFEFVVVWIMIIGSLVAVVVIIISFIRDRKKYKANMEKGNDTIFRRKK